MNTVVGYALFFDADDELFIGSVIKGLRQKCSRVYYDYQGDGELQNAMNLAANMMSFEVDELWLIAPERLPTESLFVRLSDELLAQVVERVIENLKSEFECEGFTPLCVRDEKEGDPKEILDIQEELKKALKLPFKCYEANLSKMIDWQKRCGNLKIHYLQSRSDETEQVSNPINATIDSSETEQPCRSLEEIAKSSQDIQSFSRSSIQSTSFIRQSNDSTTGY